MSNLTERDLDKIHILITSELNKIRSSVIEAERLLRVTHQDRHPMPKQEIDLSPTEPLSPEDRADIDAIP